MRNQYLLLAAALVGGVFAIVVINVVVPQGWAYIWLLYLTYKIAYSNGELGGMSWTGQRLG